MRKGIGADSRIAPGKLFFDGVWGQPLQADADMTQVLEMVRWAPSAANKQPCRTVFDTEDPGISVPEDAEYIASVKIS